MYPRNYAEIRLWKPLLIAPHRVGVPAMARRWAQTGVCRTVEISCCGCTVRPVGSLTQLQLVYGAWDFTPSVVCVIFVVMAELAPSSRRRPACSLLAYQSPFASTAVAARAGNSSCAPSTVTRHS